MILSYSFGVYFKHLEGVSSLYQSVWRKNINKIWKEDMGFGELVQWLRTLIALVEESDPSTYKAAHKYHSGSRRSNSLVWPP